MPDRPAAATAGGDPRSLLLGERAAAQARVEALVDDRAGVVAASSAGENDDEHDPEGATVAFERAQLEALIAAARVRVEELDDALARLAEGRYGRCERCGTPITPARLAARPAARTCVRCAAGPG